MAQNPSNSNERQNFYDELQNLTNKTQVYTINVTHDFRGIVILGPQDKLKKAAIQVDVFLNHLAKLVNTDRQKQ